MPTFTMFVVVTPVDTNNSSSDCQSGIVRLRSTAFAARSTVRRSSGSVIDMWSGVNVTSRIWEKEKNHAVNNVLEKNVSLRHARKIRKVSSHEAKASNVHTTATMNIAQFTCHSPISQAFS